MPITKGKNTSTQLNEFGSFVGFVLCHAVWSIADGEMLVPIFASIKNTKRKLERLEGDNAKNVNYLKKKLVENATESECLVIVYDGYVTLDDKKNEALIVEAIAQTSKVILALPYINAKSNEGFKLYKVAIVESNSVQINDFLTAFRQGVLSHQEGAKIWQKFGETR